MTTKKIRLVTIILFITIVMINSCKKNNDEPLQLSQDLLTSDTWYITSVTTTPAITGSVSTMKWNLSDSINKYATQPCVADNEIEFLPGNIYKISEGATYCNSYTAKKDSGNYAYDSIAKTLTILQNNNSLTLNVEQTDNSTFKANVDFSWDILAKFTPISSSDLSQMKPYTKVETGTKIIVTYSKNKKLNVEKLPEITTDSTSNLSKTSAKIYANLKSLGSATSIKIGICWSETNNKPTMSDNKIEIGTKINSGTFNKEINGLRVSTTYFYRAYAIFNNSTIYSEVKSFRTANATLDFTLPNASTNWKTGTTNNISWSTDATGNLKIDLYKAGMFISTITTAEINWGSFSFYLSNTVEDGTDYNIKITNLSSNLVSTSKNFKISHPESLAVLFPTNGFNATPGSTCNIDWTNNTSGNVKIELYKANSFVSSLSSSISDGPFTWSVPSDLNAGTDYTIRITNLNSLESANSANFTVTPIINISFPAPGVVWQKNSTQTITWSSNFTGNVTIEIYYSYQPTPFDPQKITFKAFISKDAVNSGSYQWIVPSNLVSRADYQVIISGEGTAVFSNYFTIN